MTDVEHRIKPYYGPTLATLVLLVQLQDKLRQLLSVRVNCVATQFTIS